MAGATAFVGVESLECTVCLSVFVCPVTLACGHTFCRDCSEGALNRGRNSQCPLCRREIDGTSLPAETVTTPPSNCLAHLASQRASQLMQRTVGRRSR